MGTSPHGRCYCTSPLGPNGRCPHRCPPELRRPGQRLRKQQTKEQRARKADAERIGISPEQATEGARRADKRYDQAVSFWRRGITR